MSEKTSSKSGKLSKRVKFAVGRSLNTHGDAETLNPRKKGLLGDSKSQSKRVKSDRLPNVNGGLTRRKNSERRVTLKGRVNTLTSINEGNEKARSGRARVGEIATLEKKYRVNGKSGRMVKKNVKDKAVGVGQDGFEGVDYGKRGFEAMHSNMKRKRIYADHGGEGERGIRTGGSNAYVQSSWKKAPAERKKSYKNESTNDKGGISSRGTGTDLSRKLSQAEAFQKSMKKKVMDRKKLASVSETTEDRPKKRKRVIRIDPLDVTNKRLDDGLSTIENKKKEDSEMHMKPEISNNARFRAIQPSPSILSFVEENLLGRRREIEFRRAGYNAKLSAPLDNIPFSTSSERERIEEPVFRNKLAFFAAAKISSSFPPADLPEIAFAGRSNVGKSSILNALTRQWGVVRTSDKPGLTQTINFFKLGLKSCLVDMPGYGFAYAKEDVKEAWEELVKEYVSTRVGLKRVCLLIDTKWGMKPRDHELVDLMERSKTRYQIVLTKTDLVFPIDVARRAMEIEESLKAKKSAVQPVMMVSSKTGAGIRSLRTVLAKVARIVRP